LQEFFVKNNTQRGHFNPDSMMTEVFITNIPDQIQAESVLKILEESFPELIINFDAGASEAPFPCGHNILRVGGPVINPENIISLVNNLGFSSGILEDKVCQ